MVCHVAIKFDVSTWLALLALSVCVCVCVCIDTSLFSIATDEMTQQSKWEIKHILEYK